MQYTNELNLPQPIADAVMFDDYSSGNSDISITSLISPPQKVQLEKIHSDEITRDVSEEIYAIMGKAIHNILERADKTAIKEQRLYTEIGGWVVSGQFDRLVLLIHQGKMVLQDYKIASVWEYIFGLKPERIEQLNCYAELIRRNYGPNFWPEKMEVVFVFRDWQKSKAKFDTDYPQRQTAIIDVPMWESSQCDHFMLEKVREHQAAKEGDIRPCTDEDRWKNPTKWAVKKVGNKRALRVYEDYESALKHVEGDEGLDLTIEQRIGVPKRCEDYCHAASFCSQYQSEIKTEAAE